MAESWYFVKDGQRFGPHEESYLVELIQKGELTNDDYVWTKSYTNWTMISDAKELKSLTNQEDPVPNFVADIPPKIEREPIDFLDPQVKDEQFFIKIGHDRKQLESEKEYGPYKIDILVKLYKERRINARTFVFHQSFSTWHPLGDIKGFEDIFDEAPINISDQEKRCFKREPFVARIFLTDKERLLEGICRDISLGGMQVLVEDHPFEVGQKIAFNVHPNNKAHHFVASGEVVRKLEKARGFSFKFTDLSTEAKSSIEAYLDK